MRIGGISKKQLYYTLIAFREWVKTKDGVKWVLKAVGIKSIIGEIGFDNTIAHSGLTVRTAPKSKTYRVVDGRGEKICDVDADDITLVTGVIVNGMLLPEDSIESYDKPTKRCDFCGVQQYCVQEGSDSLYQRVKICNYCAYHARDQGILDYVSYDECLNCNVMSCSNNPGRKSNKKHIKLLN